MERLKSRLQLPIRRVVISIVYFPGYGLIAHTPVISGYLLRRYALLKAAIPKGIRGFFHFLSSRNR